MVKYSDYREGDDTDEPPVYTLDLNGTVYELSEEFLASIEQRATDSYAENEYVDCWWATDERGSPVLTIETSGTTVPWSMLETMDSGVDGFEQSQGSNNNDIDSGNGMRSVPRDDVAGSDKDTAQYDTAFMMPHPSQNFVPQPEEENATKVPMDPIDMNEDVTYVMWIPDGGEVEDWGVGTAIIPQEFTVQWNLQKKADEAPWGSRKLVPDSEGHVSEKRVSHDHDRWEMMMKMYNCTPNDWVDDEVTDDTGRQPDEWSEGTFGGQNWNM